MIRLKVANMTCAGCAKGVTRVIQGLSADAKVEVDLSTRLVSVMGAVEETEVIAALKRAGFEPETRGFVSA